MANLAYQYNATIYTGDTCTYYGEETITSELKPLIPGYWYGLTSGGGFVFKCYINSFIGTTYGGGYFDGPYNNCTLTGTTLLPNCDFDLGNIKELYLANLQTNGSQLSYPINFHIEKYDDISILAIKEWSDTKCIIGSQEIVLYKVLNSDNSISLSENMVIDNRSHSYVKTLTFELPYIDYELLQNTRTLLLENANREVDQVPTIAFLIDGNGQQICVGYDVPLNIVNIESNIGQDHLMRFTMTSTSASRFRYFENVSCVPLNGFYVEEICPTPTPSMTPTPTPTRTPTPTVPAVAYLIDDAEEGDYEDACTNVTGTTITVYLPPQYSDPVDAINDFFYTDSSLTTRFTGNYSWQKVIKNGVDWAVFLLGNGLIASAEDCILPSPTPTRTPSPTPSRTPTPTPTISTTPSITPSPSPDYSTTITIYNSSSMSYNITNVQVDGMNVIGGSFPVVPGNNTSCQTTRTGPSLDVRVDFSGVPLGGEYITIDGVNKVCEEVTGPTIWVSGNEFDGTATRIDYELFCY